MAFSIEEIRHLYDFQSRYLDLDGLQYHYLDEGRGEAIVMLHGNPSWSFMYRDLIRSLRQDYRVIAPDHIGCGLSDKPGNGRYDYRLKTRVEDLQCLLDRLGLHEKITLVMHDWGGPIGMSYAVRHPGSVARLILFNTTAFLPPGKQLPPSLRWCAQSSFAAFLIRRFNLFSRAACRLGCRRAGMPREIRRAYTGPYQSGENSLATLRFVQDIPLTPEHPSYSYLRKTEEDLHLLRDRPALICWGEQDFVFDRDFREEWERRLSRAEVHRFPEAGHYVLEEAPEVIPTLVWDFLSRHPLEADRQ